MLDLVKDSLMCRYAR